MDFFPRPDPIPLPAPVWLFKALHSLTLALHFSALHLMLGGLIVVVAWSALGGLSRNSLLRRAAAAGTVPLPIVMTFVINFGVPPLLFTQVLYGRALYTSSVLIGFFWIAVIGLLMFAYFFQYVAARSAKSGGQWTGLAAALSLSAVLCIAFIYSNNMTLMLRPDHWAALYRRSAGGLNLNAGDPTLLPRLSYMIAASLCFSGVGLWMLGQRRGLDEGTGQLMRRWGAAQSALFAPAVAAAGFWVMRTQSPDVAQSLNDSAFYSQCIIVWIAAAGIAFLLGALGALLAKKRGWALPAIAGLAAFVNIASMVLVRDGIRDATLKAAGFNVWARDITANWTVVGLFLVLFVLGLITVGWMVWVVARGKGEVASHA